MFKIIGLNKHGFQFEDQAKELTTKEEGLLLIKELKNSMTKVHGDFESNLDNIIAFTEDYITRIEAVNRDELPQSLSSDKSYFETERLSVNNKNDLTEVFQRLSGLLNLLHNVVNPLIHYTLSTQHTNLKEGITQSLLSPYPKVNDKLKDYTRPYRLNTNTGNHISSQLHSYYYKLCSHQGWIISLPSIGTRNPDVLQNVRVRINQVGNPVNIRIPYNIDNIPVIKKNMLAIINGVKVQLKYYKMLNQRLMMSVHHLDILEKDFITRYNVLKDDNEAKQLLTKLTRQVIHHHALLKMCTRLGLSYKENENPYRYIFYILADIENYLKGHKTPAKDSDQPT